MVYIYKCEMTHLHYLQDTYCLPVSVSFVTYISAWGMFSAYGFNSLWHVSAEAYIVFRVVITENGLVVQKANRKCFYFLDGSPMIPEFCDSCRQIENMIFVHRRHQPYNLLGYKPIQRVRKEISMVASKKESENYDSFLKSLAECAKQDDDLA